MLLQNLDVTMMPQIIIKLWIAGRFFKWNMSLYQTGEKCTQYRMR